MRTLLGALLSLFSVLLAAPSEAAPPVSVIQIEGVISPVAFRLIASAIDRAQAEGSQALVIQLDTPGGLERSMRSIVQKMLNAPIPVVVYVSPTGARAASAGVFITLAAHVAAMAPATNIGAAHPVTVGSGQTDKEVLKKITNDAAAFIRSIALERGHNVEWAESAVRSSVSATEKEALKLGVIDLLADTLPDLLAKIDGRRVKLVSGARTLQTKAAMVKRIEIGFRDRFLNLITDPNIAYILMMIGMLGVFFELANPGVILPGVLGGISLILAFFAFQSLPINYAGLLLILFGIILLIAEIKVVSHGVLSIGGVVSLILGSLMLIEAPEADLRISWMVIIPVVATTTGFFAFAVAAGVRAQMRQPSTGQEGIVGAIGVVRSPCDPVGQVFVRGELWRAQSDGGPLKEGERVRVVAMENLTLKVTRIVG